MDEESVFFEKRLRELANKSYTGGQYFFTGFLSLSEQDVYHRLERELSYVPARLFGGTEDCERMMLRFGGEELCGWETDFPIACIEISPLMEKYGEELSHRDYLGALMNLGIERSTLGDIIICGKHAFLFCAERMASFVLENLEQVRHTHVKCSLAEQVPESAITHLERKNCIVNSNRADAIIAKLYQLSRSQSLELFREKKVFVGGRQCENNSAVLLPNDRVSVRGYGKFIFRGQAYETKKGKSCVEVDLYM